MGIRRDFCLGAAMAYSQHGAEVTPEMLAIGLVSILLALAVASSIQISNQ
jgi:hypothetical protein